MRYSIVPTLALLSAAVAVPTPDADPVRILPSFWTFNLTSFRGPGCPDKADGLYTTRYTFGMNTMDGSEIYYSHIAYPFLRASVDAENDEAHTWCETTLKYLEIDNFDSYKPKADYRFRQHKNGTRIISTYDLEEGVTATWKFTYYPPDDDEVVDTITVDGPFKSQYSGEAINSPVPKDIKTWKAPECGKTTIKFRADLYLSSDKEGAKGTVQGDKPDGTHNYGVQQGWSYDWEKCLK